MTMCFTPLVMAKSFETAEEEDDEGDEAGEGDRLLFSVRIALSRLSDHFRVNKPRPPRPRKDSVLSIVFVTTLMYWCGRDCPGTGLLLKQIGSTANPTLEIQKSKGDRARDQSLTHLGMMQ